MLRRVRLARALRVPHCLLPLVRWWRRPRAVCALVLFAHPVERGLRPVDWKIRRPHPVKLSIPFRVVSRWAREKHWLAVVRSAACCRAHTRGSVCIRPYGGHPWRVPSRCCSGPSPAGVSRSTMLQTWLDPRSLAAPPRSAALRPRASCDSGSTMLSPSLAPPCTSGTDMVRPRVDPLLFSRSVAFATASHLQGDAIQNYLPRRARCLPQRAASSPKAPKRLSQKRSIAAGVSPQP